MEKPVVQETKTGSSDDGSRAGKKKKKRGSSKASRRLEDIESRVSKSVHRVSKAVENGVSTYIDKRDRSARKRRDGALVDFQENVAGGMAKAIAESSPALSDLAEAINTRRRRKQIRKFVRALPLR